MDPAQLPIHNALDPPDWLVAFGRAIRRIGMIRTVVLATAFSTIVSVAMTAAAIQYFQPTSMRLGLGISSTVSLLVSATVSYVLCSVVADLERTRHLMWRLVNIDVLTQAYTRRFFMDRARRTVMKQRAATLVLIDIDDFKRINDTHGHAAGDVVLHSVSKVCRRVLGSSGLFARYGGEEFAVLMQETSPLVASEQLDALRCRVAALSTPVPGGSRLRVTASIGIAALRPHDSGNVDRALRDALAAADRALYRAKGLGKNRVLIDPLSLPLVRDALSESGADGTTTLQAMEPAVSSVIESVIADSLDHRFDHRADQRVEQRR